MLNRFRDLMKRLELPDEERDIVYRIIDDNFNAVEVTKAQYAMWRMQNDVTQKAIVGLDIVEDIRVGTTFSIMPEKRNYKPFGTFAFDMTSLDPLVGFSSRYDTWREAERGHRETLDRIRREYARARATDQRAEALAGAAGEVRLAISADLPAMFKVEPRSESEVTVLTPLLRADGTSIELSVSASGAAFTLISSVEASAEDSVSTLENLKPEQVERLCGALGVSAEPGALACRADDASQLGRAIVRLAQAVACVSYLPNASG